MFVPRTSLTTGNHAAPEAYPWFLDGYVPFCLVAASETRCSLARDVVAALNSTGGIVARSAALGSLAFRTDRAPDAIILALDASAIADAVELIRRVQSDGRTCFVLAVGERLTPEAVSTLRASGSFEYLADPRSAEAIASRIRSGLHALSATRCTDVRELLNPRVMGLIGNSPAFLKQVSKLPTIAGCDAGVLILGETGTGKEVCAQAIHYLSARASKPWVAVNCGAIPNDLVEDELFGHVKGAYTTALTERRGLVREAEAGSLFLDDVDALAHAAQAKLLRFLQEKEYRPVGSNTVHRANVRLIAASNHKLADMARQGTFREDLFFRLNVLTLHLPPLRERREDVALLAMHFLRQCAQHWRRKVEGISSAALERMSNYAWPGNVRELKHVIERAVLLTERPVLAADDIELNDHSAPVPAGEPFQRAKARAIEQFERTYIEQLLIDHQGNISRAARAASKNRRALWQLIRKHRIEAQRFRTPTP
jgi:two-component system response regulator GlrR